MLCVITGLLLLMVDTAADEAAAVLWAVTGLVLLMVDAAADDEIAGTIAEF